MFLENFILRFVKLQAGFVSVLSVEENAIVFRKSEASETVVSDLKDLLSALIDKEDGEFVVSGRFTSDGIKLEFVEAEN